MVHGFDHLLFSIGLALMKILFIVHNIISLSFFFLGDVGLCSLTGDYIELNVLKFSFDVIVL